MSFCPECGECWRCYDSGTIEIEVCSKCEKTEFEEVTMYDYYCSSCDYTTTTLEEKNITCPKCGDICYLDMDYIDKKCNNCGSTSTKYKEIDCPDCAQ